MGQGGAGGGFRVGLRWFRGRCRVGGVVFSVYGGGFKSTLLLACWLAGWLASSRIKDPET